MNDESVNFNEGDLIEMKVTCSGANTGDIIALKKDKEGHFRHTMNMKKLYAPAPEGEGGGCCCPQKWTLIKSNKTMSFERIIEKINNHESKLQNRRIGVTTS